MNSLDKITYITLPSTLALDLGTMKIDTSIKVPFSIPDDKEKLGKEDYTVENLMSGLITVVAEDEKNINTAYYKKFIKALDPDIPVKLNQAAIAKEQKGEYDFASLLFKAVYHLLPQSASCINLATLYSYMAADAAKKGEDNREYIKKAKETLLDGLEKFGENEELLYETASFLAYMAELEDAVDYIKRYLSVAGEGERKEEMKKLLEETSFKLENQEKIEEAYDFLSLGESDRALPIIELFIKKNPKIWNGYFLRGWALRIKEEYKEATECFLKCIELGESNSEIYNELGLCALKEGNSDLSEIYFETALDSDEENLTVLTNLSYLELERKDWDKARKYLEKARFTSGNDAILDALIKKYEKETGDKIGEVIHEEIVKGDEEKNGESIKDNLFKSFEKADDEVVCNCGKDGNDN